MKKKNQDLSASAKTAEIELAKTLKEQTKTRIELAKTRREQTKTRTELAKTRTEHTKIRAELAKARKKKSAMPAKQVEKTLQRVVHKEFDMQQKILPPQPRQLSADEFSSRKNYFEKLTNRQREILKLIATSRNTKQIAGILNVSPKTIEYHRGKLMAALKVHDVPGLVRFALRLGLVPLEA